MNAMPYSLEICNVRVKKVLDKGAEYDGRAKVGIVLNASNCQHLRTRRIADSLVKNRNCDRVKTCWCRYDYGNFVLQRPYHKLKFFISFIEFHISLYHIQNKWLSTWEWELNILLGLIGLYVT